MSSDKPKFDPSQPFDSGKPAFDPSKPFDQGEEPSTLSRVGTLAKQFFLTGHPNAPGHEPIEPSIGQALSYPAGVVSTGVIQGAKQALNGTGSMEDFKQALQGNAKSAPQQLQESGMSPVASYAAGIPLQIATDPFASFLSMKGRGAADVPSYISQRLRDKAGRMAEKATAGTPKQLSEIPPGTGNLMLDKDIVRPLSGPMDIVNNAQNAIEEAYSKAPLSQADIGPAPASIRKEEILKGLDDKIGEFAKDESKANIVGQLQKIRDSAASDLVPDERNLSAVEQIKKNFANRENWDNPFSGQAPKTASGVYRDLVEQKAAQYSPELGQQYTEAKKLYQALNPAIEAAEGGAARQAARSPVTLKDITSMAAAGPKGIIAQRILTSPRLQSTGAWALNKASKVAPNNSTVASIIASRAASSQPKVPEQLRQDFLNQQTSPSAQDELKKSQE